MLTAKLTGLKSTANLLSADMIRIREISPPSQTEKIIESAVCP